MAESNPIGPYTREQAYEASLEYFNGNTLQADTFVNKYALRDREGRYYELTPDDMHLRIAREFARVEAKYPNGLTEDEILKYIKNFRYIVPQGSPMFGIGNNHQLVSLSNCSVFDSPEDTMSSIVETGRDMANLYKRRFGTGGDLGNLRPEGASVNNAAISSTGAWSFANLYSFITDMVGQSGRRGALMLTMPVEHPDIEKFTTMKLDRTKVTRANVSIRASDDFMHAVVNDEDWTLRWPLGSVVPVSEPHEGWVSGDDGYSYPEGDSRLAKFWRTVRARDLFALIAQTACDSAEPGLLFWDTIRRNLPLDFYEGFRTISTNPCGEIPLCAWDSCRLISIYLALFVKNPFTEDAYFDFGEFWSVARVAMRLSDDLVDLELEKLYAIRDQADTPDERELFDKFIEKAEKGRRTGLGTHGLADALARLGLRYDSEEGIEMIDAIYRTLKYAAYTESVNMAEERGAFPIWNPDVEAECDFFARKSAESVEGHELVERMRRVGRRNGALLTNAPTGSVSILSDNCSSGIEPVFLNSYTRRRKLTAVVDDHLTPDYVDENGDRWKEYTVYHANVEKFYEVQYDLYLKKNAARPFGVPVTFEEFKALTPLPDYFVQSSDIDWLQRVRVQATVQQHLDHSISSTINLPKEATPEDVAAIYTEAWKLGCKGITVYRDGSRDGQVLSAISEEKEGGEAITGADLVQGFVTADKLPAEAPCGKCRTHRGKVTHGPMHKASFRDMVGGGERKVYVYVGMNEANEPVEAFVIDEQGDEDLRPYAAAVGKLTSLALKFGIPPEEVEDALIGLKGGSIAYEDSIYQSVPDLVGRVIRKTRKEAEIQGDPVRLAAREVDRHVSKAILDAVAVSLDTGALPMPTVTVPQDNGIPGARKCPSCGQKTLIPSDCPRCDNCGFARCG